MRRSRRAGAGNRIDLLPTVVPLTDSRDPGDVAALVAAARRGDHAAFDRLYHRFVRMVHGLLLARVPARDVDDLVQDVFARAYERLGSLRDAAAFGGWLATMARHRAADYHRQVRPTVELVETAGADGPRHDTALAVLAALRGLPEAYRDTLTLRLIEGLTGPEIAERTGLTPGSVRVNLHRGMRRLRQALGDERDDHD